MHAYYTAIFPVARIRRWRDEWVRSFQMCRKWAKKISTETRSEFPLFCLDLPVFPWQRPLGEFRITIIMSPFPLVVPVIFGFDYPGRFHPRDLRCPSAVKSFCNFLEAQVLPIWSRSIYKSLGSQDRPIENVKCLNYDSNKQSSFSFSF